MVECCVCNKEILGPDSVMDIDKKTGNLGSMHIKCHGSDISL